MFAKTIINQRLFVFVIIPLIILENYFIIEEIFYK